MARLRRLSGTLQTSGANCQLPPTSSQSSWPVRTPGRRRQDFRFPISNNRQPAADSSRVVVKEELVGMGPQVDRRYILGALQREPGLQHIRGEHVAFQQEGMILLQRI